MFVDAVPLSELRREGSARVVLEDADGMRHDVALFYEDDAPDGRDVYAVGDVCTHAGASLSEGGLRDGVVRCPRHGAPFDIRTGEPLGYPASDAVPTYETQVRDGDVYVNVG